MSSPGYNQAGGHDQTGAGRHEPSGSREPLHQPPDPRDLAAFPPQSSACAIVRGQLRDFVDGDLSHQQRGMVEHHVHTCRTCAVALSRAEHELLLLRRAFTSIAREDGAREDGAREGGGVAPRPGFAARVVNRLVMDETSLLSREALSRATPESGGITKSAAGSPAYSPNRPLGGAVGARGANAGGAIPRRQLRLFQLAGWVHSPAQGLLLTLALLILVAVGVTFLDDGDGKPENSPRLVITHAADTYGDFGKPLGLGDGLGEDQTLWVGRHGEASADWHDASRQTQPVAHLQVSNRGQVRLQGGEPLLVNGNLEVNSVRPVTIPVADGSRLELGAGEYLISVEHLDGPPRGLESLAGAPESLRVAVEVLRGDAAVVVRAEQSPALIAVGRIGVYQGSSSVAVTAGPNLRADFGDLTVRGAAPNLSAVRQARVRGSVRERSGAPVVGADVLLSFASGGLVRSAGATVAANGGFELITGPVGSSTACDSGFAIVQVVPPAARGELGLTVPDAIQLHYVDGDAHLANSPVLDVSTPFDGRVVDDSGSSRNGIRVVPCVVDELFRAVLVWAEGQVTSGFDGSFHLTRLPAVLPSHQHLALLLVHPELETVLVPVPLPGSQAMRAFQARFVLPRLRLVQVEGLPASSSIQLFEDVVGMPPGMAMTRRSAVSDAQGRLHNLRVGNGTLWMRNTSPSHPMVRRLAPSSPGSSVTVYQPVGGMPQPYESVFAAMQPLAGSEVFVASSYRYQRLSAQSAHGVQRGQRIDVIDAASQRTVAGAQVFAVGAMPVRGNAGVRFLGFTSASGVLVADLVDNEAGLLVIGPDGSTGIGSDVRVGDDVAIATRGGGRVLLGASLRPAPHAGRDVVSIRFEGADLGAAGQQVVAVRFACSALGWECGDLPPGSYRAIIDGQAHPVEVPVSGLVVLQ